MRRGSGLTVNQRMPAKPQPKRKALGRGLAALLPTPPTEAPKPNGSAVEAAEGLRSISVELIDPNPYQPRRVFKPKALEELARSIRADGLVQPIIVRNTGSRFSLIVGERRLRAAKLAGLAEIPALVREIDQDRILEVTLIENIQREDLSPIEVAEALQRMIDELRLSHEEVASRTGQDRSTITNLLRLLRLPPDVRELIAEGRISGSHARAIAGLDDAEQQRALAEKTVAQGLSVRQVERTVRALTASGKGKSKHDLDPNVAAALNDLEQRLGTKVRLIGRGKGKGKIEIEYYSAEDLERIYSMLMGE